MSLPNSPADPYPEAFGWPWHGLIRRPASAAAVAAEIVLPSSATRAMQSGGGIGYSDFTWSHPFVVPGLPEPDIPTETDQSYLTRGIRRGSNAAWWWDRTGPVPCVRNGQPWRVLDLYLGAYGNLRRLYVSALMESPSGERITIEHISPSENSFNLPAEYPTYNIQRLMLMAGGSGDRWLYVAIHSRFPGDWERCGIFEVLLEPENGIIRVEHHATYPDMYQVLSVVPTSDSSPTWVIYYYNSGPPVVLPYGTPPSDPNFIDSTTYSVGSMHYSIAERWIFWAWYRADAVTVDLCTIDVTLDVTREFGTTSLGRFFENVYETRTLTLNGEDMLELRGEAEEDFSTATSFSQTTKYLAQSDVLFESSRGEYPGGHGPVVHLAPYAPTGDRSVDYAGPSAIALGPSALSMRVTVSNLSNAVLAMQYLATVGGVRRHFQSAAVSPSGLDPGSHVIANIAAITEDQGRCWNSGAWNPVTGEVRRADLNYRYNWV